MYSAYQFSCDRLNGIECWLVTTKWIAWKHTYICQLSWLSVKRCRIPLFSICICLSSLRQKKQLIFIKYFETMNIRLQFIPYWSLTAYVHWRIQGKLDFAPLKDVYISERSYESKSESWQSFKQNRNKMLSKL